MGKRFNEALAERTRLFESIELPSTKHDGGPDPIDNHTDYVSITSAMVRRRLETGEYDLVKLAYTGLHANRVVGPDIDSLVVAITACLTRNSVFLFQSTGTK